MKVMLFNMEMKSSCSWSICRILIMNTKARRMLCNITVLCFVLFCFDLLCFVSKLRVHYLLSILAFLRIPPLVLLPCISAMIFSECI